VFVNSPEYLKMLRPAQQDVTRAKQQLEDSQRDLHAKQDLLRTVERAMNAAQSLSTRNPTDRRLAGDLQNTKNEHSKALGEVRQAQQKFEYSQRFLDQTLLTLATQMSLQPPTGP